MQITVSGHNIQMTQALKEYSEKKIGKLDIFFSEALEKGLVELEHHSSASPEKMNEAKVIVYVHGAILSAKEENQDMYAAIDLIFEKLEKQLKKYKEKMKDHKKEKSSVLIDEIMKEMEPVTGMSDDPVVYTVRQTLKPMSIEEATMQLKISKMAFMAFRNSTNNQMNVIYKRKDGDFGLIEPE